MSLNYSKFLVHMVLLLLNVDLVKILDNLFLLTIFCLAINVKQAQSSNQ